MTIREEESGKIVHRVATAAISVGMLLYLSKFLRPYFTHQETALFILGILPNFGMSLAIPFIYILHRQRLKKTIDRFAIVCCSTLLLMVLNEIRDYYQKNWVFDWMDMAASFVGVLIAYLIYSLMPLKLSTKK